MDGITSHKDLFSEAEQIQSFSEITVSDDPQEIVERIGALGVYIARTGKMLADAKYHLSVKLKDETVELIRKTLAANQLSAKVQNSLVDGICRDERYLVDWIERLNRALTHQQDAMRSLLSYEKENLRITKTGY
ncbi:MAG: hypothetical protein LBK58_08710 [Prevotellaceae bacterium]|jgi:hypothetical protein|nr:hypothetical protein [Prevotellaceae bacterium]